jgi:hexosaminidase
MTEDQTTHVLGGQANLWSEYIPTEEHSEYMIFPRLAALAEAVWSPKELRDWEDFSERVKVTFKRYEYRGIDYAKSAYLITPKAETDLTDKSVKFILASEFSNADIKYVLGSASLQDEAKNYTGPIELNETTIIKAAVYSNDEIVGKVFTDTIRFHKAIATKVSYVKPYSEKYKGTGPSSLVNTLRGSKNHSDGQWQAWLNEDMQATIDLKAAIPIKQVTIGLLENQNSWIYFPTEVEVWVSEDGESYESVGKLEHPYKANPGIEKKDLSISFEETTARFVKVNATNLMVSPNGGGVWIFIDEILVE